MTEENYDPKQKQRRDVATGLPVMEEEHAKSMSNATTLVALAYLVICPAIGFGIAFAIYSAGDTAQYDTRIAIAKELRLQWPMLSVILF